MGGSSSTMTTWGIPVVYGSTYLAQQSCDIPLTVVR